MSRMSAGYVAQRVGKSVSWVYDLWEEMGLVVKDKFGDWALTDVGRERGGRMSENPHTPVPTFKFEIIEQMMLDFYEAHYGNRK